jgi:hypothetical protein
MTGCAFCGSAIVRMKAPRFGCTQKKPAGVTPSASSLQLPAPVRFRRTSWVSVHRYG